MTIERKRSLLGVLWTRKPMSPGTVYCVFTRDKKYPDVVYKKQMTILSPDLLTLQTSVFKPHDFPPTVRNGVLCTMFLFKEEINNADLSGSFLPGIKEQIVWRA